MKKAIILLAVMFLSLQMICGQLVTVKTNTMLFCTREGNKWSDWSKPTSSNVDIILYDNQTVLVNNKFQQLFKLHDHIGRDQGINTEYNDIYEANTYLSTDKNADTVFITIFRYDSGNRAFSILYPNIQYVYFTRK